MSASVLSSFVARRNSSASQTERRQLEPICNALQQHQNKLALRLCTKVSEKSPDHHVVKALKAICLFRLARLPEAIIICDDLSLNTSALGDADVLLLVSWIYHEIARDDLLLDMLDEAARLHGHVEDVGIQAFTHFVRLGDTKRMQQLALKMYKSIEQPYLQTSPYPIDSASSAHKQPSLRYLYWSVMAIILHSLNLSSSDPSAALLCSLATRIFTSARGIVRAGDVASSLTEQDFYVRLRLLEVRARARKAPAKSESPFIHASSATSTLDAESARAELLNAFVTPEGNKWCERHLGLELWRRESEWTLGGEAEWERGRTRCISLLREGDTNWSTILYLIRFTIKLWQARQHQQSTDVHGNSQARTSHAMSALSTMSLEMDDDRALPSSMPMVTELLRWTYDHLYSLAYSPKKHGATERPRISLGGIGVDSTAQERPDLDGEQSYDAIKSSRHDRGFLLGLLELVKSSREAGAPLPSTKMSTLCQLIEDYVVLHGNKPVCFEDLRPYLQILTSAERRELLQSITARPTDVDEMTSPASLQNLINRAKIQRCLKGASDRSASAQKTDFKQYMNWYFASLPLGKEIPASDLHPADDLVLLAAHSKVAAWQTSHSVAELEDAVYILEYGLTRSAFNYQMRLLLLRLYLLLGAPLLAETHYRILDPKQIQHDTLSHFMFTRASTLLCGTGADSTIENQLVRAVQWYQTGEKEAIEACVRIWKTGTFTKLEDYMKLSNRLKLSLSKSLLQLEYIRSRLLHSILPKDEVQTIRRLLETINANSHASLYDNRDIGIFVNYNELDAASLYDATCLGPDPVTEYLHTFAHVYIDALTCDRLSEPAKVSARDLAHPTSSTERIFTPSEMAFLHSYESPNFWNAPDRDQRLTSFFSDRLRYLQDLLLDTEFLPWELAHVAQLSLEAFCVLELRATLHDQMTSQSTSITSRTGGSIRKDTVSDKSGNATGVLKVARTVLSDMAHMIKDYVLARRKRRRSSQDFGDLSAYPLLRNVVTAKAAALEDSQATFLVDLSQCLLTRSGRQSQ